MTSPRHHHWPPPEAVVNFLTSFLTPPLLLLYEENGVYDWYFLFADTDFELEVYFTNLTVVITPGDDSTLAAPPVPCF